MSRVAYLIVGCLMVVAAHAAMAAEIQNMDPVHSISVSGMAERKVTPDEAHLNVNVGATAAKVETAKAEHDKKLRTVMDIAKKAAIDEAQMKTLNSSIQPQYRYENNKQIFKGYRVQTSLDITVKKVEVIGDLMEKLSSAGLETSDSQEWGSLLNVSYTVANPDKVRDDMLADAIKNARSKADNMASAAGGSVGRVIQINEGSAPSFNFPPMPMMARGKVMAMAASDGAAPMAPPVGEQVVNAQVNVIFELK